ncbi:signal peptidase II [Sporolituus thermophilus]|uniref:Lipoprotein signal peptidase n=1 Tax=Sporolituus thermophilus DSM 23256 TaxID=1123285 RepID=A0A1G7KSJ7_9FIRM|nr:signal peptidase II [Sporolituus thermophilus]SDF39910.1 signal peptidase II [Sporolituus thermophilus DSM 23256]
MPILLLVAGIVVLDQLSKFYFLSRMLPGDSIPIISGIFHITLILNPGAAFGLFEHQRIFFIVVAALMLGAVAYYVPRIPAGMTLLRWGAGLMAGGAAGNVIDRIRTGYVVDFFDFRIWPIFNIADIAIVTGVACIIFTLVKSGQEKDDSLDK